MVTVNLGREGGGRHIIFFSCALLVIINKIVTAVASIMYVRVVEHVFALVPTPLLPEIHTTGFWPVCRFGNATLVTAVASIMYE